jgi:hypothetical protein
MPLQGIARGFHRAVARVQPDDAGISLGHGLRRRALAVLGRQRERHQPGQRPPVGGLWWPMFRMALVQIRAAGGLLGGICGGGALELADGVGALAPRSGSRFS